MEDVTRLVVYFPHRCINTEKQDGIVLKFERGNKPRIGGDDMEVYTLKQAARNAKIGVETLKRACEEGLVRASQLPNRQWRIAESTFTLLESRCFFLCNPIAAKSSELSLCRTQCRYNRCDDTEEERDKKRKM